MKKDLLLLLQEDFALLRKAVDILSYSLERCEQIEGPHKGAHDAREDLDTLEAFTSRFARLSDLLIQKVFRLIDRIDLEDEGTVRDRIYRAEKKGLIKRAETFIEIREIRNSIAHEYMPEVWKTLYKKALSLTPALIESARRVEAYAAKYTSRSI